MLPSEIRYKWVYDEHNDKKNIQKFIDKCMKLIETRFGKGYKYYINGSKEEGKFELSFITYNNNNTNSSIQWSMTFYYPVKHELITTADNVYNDYDLEIILNNRSQLLYVYIKSLYISPQDNGLGTYIIVNMINFIKEIFAIKFIALTSKHSACNFWKKIGFVDVSYEEHYDLIKLSHHCYYNELIYVL